MSFDQYPKFGQTDEAGVFKRLDNVLARIAAFNPQYSDEQVEADLKQATVALMVLRGELVQPTQRVKVCRDPQDDVLIEAALAGNAEYIVTGDEDLLVLRKFENVRVVTSQSFRTALPSGTPHC